MTLTHVVCGLETLTPKNTGGTTAVEMTATVGGANVEEIVDDLIKFAGTGAQTSTSCGDAIVHSFFETDGTTPFTLPAWITYS